MFSKVIFNTSSESHYEFDLETRTLTRSNPRNNIVGAAEPGMPPFEGPSWKVEFAMFLGPQAMFLVEGRADPLVTTGLVNLGVQ